MKKKLSVLIIEDSADDAELILKHLEKGGYETHSHRVETSAAMLNALEEEDWDVIISDYSLPRFSGLKALEVSKEKKADIPFIIVSGTVGETLAVEAMRAGAHDYVMKDNLTRLVPAVERELRDAEIRMKRRQAEEALKVAEKEKMLILDSTSEMFIFMNTDLIIHWSNRAAGEAVGKKASDLIGQHCYEVWFNRKDSCEDCPIQLTIEKQSRQEGEITLPDGRTWLMRGYPVFDRDDCLIGVTAFGQDITARKAAETALKESEERYRSLVDNLGIGVFLINRDLRVETFNQQINDWFPGVDPEEKLLCKEAFGVLCPEVNGQQCPAEKAFKDGKRHEIISTIMVDGEKRNLRLVATPVKSDNGKVTNVIELVEDITERRTAEEALQKSEEKYRMVVENANDGIVVTHGEYMDFFNPRICEFTGYDAEDLKKMPFLDLIHPEDRQMVGNRLRRRLAGEDAERFYPIRIIDKSGNMHWLEISPEKIEWEGKPAVLAFISEITEKKRLEEELRQAQKMEAVGRLAGGVAHDFNNLLTVIEGYGDMLIGQTEDGSMMQRGIQQILAAGKRAEALTRQLLTFSRKQVLQTKIINLNALIAETEKMLRRLIGEDVELISNLTNELQDIKADPGQMEQVIMNLVINARDAMPEGGRITIKTTMKHITLEESKTFNEIKPGHYIQLDISDTGCGIDPQNLTKIFEPFFTTKEHGKGTGLGLSTVFGIVKQSNGDIQVETEPGKGTTFSIILPCVTQEVYLEEKEASEKINLEGSETILVVEDEDQVRLLIRKTLQNKGYTVHEADNGNEAVEIFEKYAGDIDLILTDVVMPGMGGRKVADTVLLSNPDKKIVYMSGYTDEAIVRHGVLDPGVNFLQKPFSSDELLQKVREVLDG